MVSPTGLSGTSRVISTSMVHRTPTVMDLPLRKKINWGSVPSSLTRLSKAVFLPVGPRLIPMSVIPMIPPILMATGLPTLRKFNSAQIRKKSTPMAMGSPTPLSYRMVLIPSLPLPLEMLLPIEFSVNPHSK